MKFLILAGLLALAHAETEYIDCGSVGTIVDFTIEGCDFLPCEMPHGSDQSATITFQPAGDSEGLTLQVLAIVLGQEQEWNGIDPDVCGSLSEGSCPVAAGDTLSTGFNIYINPAFPYYTVPVDMKITDDNGDVQACVHFEVQIVE